MVGDINVSSLFPCFPSSVCLLVMARSLISSSELGALNQSTRFAVGNSRPMTGVVSNHSYWSKTPVVLRGSLCSKAGAGLVVGMEAALDRIGVSMGVVSTAEGAMFESQTQESAVCGCI